MYKHPWRPTSSSFGYIPQSGIAGSGNSLFNFLRNNYTVSITAVPFYIPKTYFFKRRKYVFLHCWKSTLQFHLLKFKTRVIVIFSAVIIVVTGLFLLSLPHLHGVFEQVPAPWWTSPCPWPIMEATAFQSGSLYLVAFQVDLNTGLSEFSVTQRRLAHGWNEFVADNSEPVWKKYLDQVGPEVSFFALTSISQGGLGSHSIFQCWWRASLDSSCPFCTVPASLSINHEQITNSPGSRVQEKQ